MGAFDAATLFQTAMVFLNRALEVSPLESLQFTHLEVISCPVINVTVWGDNLEHVERVVSPRGAGAYDTPTPVVLLESVEQRYSDNQHIGRSLL
ncbi:MAG: hypothetical protein ACFE0J_23410 [Elainellaceae cyanobacterium]